MSLITLYMYVLFLAVNVAYVGACVKMSSFVDAFVLLFTRSLAIHYIERLTHKKTLRLVSCTACRMELLIFKVFYCLD